MTVNFVKPDRYENVSRVSKGNTYTDIYKYIKYSDGYKEELVASIFNANITLVSEFHKHTTEMKRLIVGLRALKMRRGCMNYTLHSSSSLQVVTHHG
jgi:hypothetical protein